MAEEEVKVGDSDPKGLEEDSQEILGDAILGKEGTPSEKPEGELEKPEGDQLKEGDEKAEKPEEKAEVKAPDEIAVQTQKLLEKHKNDPKTLAKVLANQYSLQGKQTGELGDLRKRSLEYDTLVKRIHDDPDGVKKDIDALHKKGEEESSLLERAYTDPAALPEFIAEKVNERVSEKERQERIEEDLTRIYPDYKQTETQRKTIAEQIEAGRFTHQELVYLVVRGFHSPEIVKDAKNLAREEDRVALAKKKGQLIDKQGVLTSDKELDLTDMDVKQEVLGDAILKAKR